MKISVFHLFLTSLFSGILLLTPSHLEDLASPTIGTTTFDGIYTTTTVVETNGGGTLVTASNIGGTGWDLSQSMAASSTLLRIVGFNNQGDGDTGDDDVVAIQNTSQTINYISMKSNDGSEFSLQSFKLFLNNASDTDHSFTVKGYRDGSAVSGATKSITGVTDQTYITVDVSADTDFQNIDEFRLESFSATGGDVTVQSRFDDIVIAAAVGGNTAPTASSFTANPSENLTYTFSTADFSYSDGDGDPLDHILIEATPASGTLYLDADNDDAFDGGEAVSVSQQISKADLDAGNLQYIQNGSTNSSFQFEVNDGTENSSGNYIATLTMRAVPTVTLSITPTSKSESTTTASIVTATLSNAYGANTTVNLAFSGTATGSGVDYTISSSSITVGAGNTTNSIVLTNVPDALYEGNETVIIDISSVSNGTESGTQQRTFTIVDDDSQPNATLEVLPIYNPITDESGGQAYVRGKIDAVAGTTITIPLSFSGTASGGGIDYSITGSTITLSPGETMDSIRITSQYDGIEEGSETVIVDMGSPTNAVESGTQQVTITINDEDATYPSTTITSGASNPTNSSPFSVTITFSESVTGFVVGDISVGNGSASNFAGSGTTYTADITPSGDGSVTVDVGAGAAQDGFGNNNTAATQLSRTYDTQAPATPAAPNLVAGWDTGTSDADDITSNTQPRFSGSTEANASIKISSSIDGQVGTSTANGSGNWLQTISGTLSEGTHNITFTATDAAGNESASSSALSVIVDTSAPTLSSSSPTDNATGINASNNITLTFNENIAFGTGNIEVIDETDATNSFTIDAANPGTQASISGTVLTINPSSDLDESSNYSVRIAATAIDDIAGNSYAGITDGTTLNFTTNFPPTVDTNTGLTMVELATATIDSGKLHASDNEATSDTQNTFTVTTAVSNGTLFIDANLNNTFDGGDTELTASNTFTQDDINNDKIRYTNASGSSDSFVFTLSDLNGGSLTNQTFNITIYPQASALDFDGSNDHVTTAGGIMNDAWTLEGWVKLNNLTSHQHFFGEVNKGFVWYEANKGIRVEYRNSANTDWRGIDQNGGSIVALTAGTWYHVAVTYGGNGTTMKVYVNGNLVTESNVINDTQKTTGTSNFSIGRWMGTEAFADRYFGGQMDEVRVWGDVRTCDEIKSNLNNGLVGNEADLLAYYNFNQNFAGENNAGNTSLTDVSGNGKTGTLTGFALTGATSNWIDGSANGVSGTTPGTAEEINVKGNNTSIVDGDNTPSTTDHTDFGTKNVSTSLERTFTIENTGGRTLTISSIQISGTNSADFVVSDEPSTVAASGSETFKVTFTPSGAGNRTATVTINSSDCDEAQYTFDLTGVGNAVPVISLGATTASVLQTGTITFNAANSNLISITDANSDNQTVTITADAGIFTLSGTTGITFDAGSNGSASMTISGTFANINAALDGATFAPNNNRGDINISISTNDGNGGTDGPDTITVSSFVDLNQGDIAFIGFNADGNNGFAIVALTTLDGSSDPIVINFTDDTWDGSSFNQSEGNLTWTISTNIAAGTVIEFSDITGTETATVGAVSVAGNMSLSASGDNIYAYVGTRSNPLEFITAITTNVTTISYSTTNTGLTDGTNAINFNGGTGLDGQTTTNDDILEYFGARDNQSTFAAYLAQIYTVSNWKSQDDTGDQSIDATEPDVPFNQTAFTLDNTAPTMVSAARNSDTEIVVTFSENVTTNAGNPTDFTVTDAAANSYAVSAQADGTAGDANIVLTVADFSAAIGEVTVKYTNNNNEISDVAGNNLATDATGVSFIPPGTATTETFESQTDAATSFLSNCQLFSLSGASFDIINQNGGGRSGSNFYIDNSGDGGFNDGFTVSIASTEDFRVNSLYLFPESATFSGYSGNLTITGKRNNATVFTLTAFGGLTAGTYNLIDFTTQDGADNSEKAIDELVFSATGDLDYIAIDDFAWETINENDAPVLVSASPTDDATAIATSSNIVLTFNECIAFGTGNIQVIDLTDGSNSFTIDVTSSGGQASISNNVLTINPSSNLDDNSNYAVQIANTAITDQGAIAYAGISDNTTLNFTTADETGPKINSTGASSNNTYIDVTFNEGVYNTNGGSGALEASDFSLALSGGTATTPVISSVKKNDNATEGSATALAGGETVIRIFFSYTNSASGAETLTVSLADGSSVYDILGNAASVTQSNNTATLNDETKPFITGVSLAADNSYIDVTFNEGVYNDVCLGGGLEGSDFDLKITGGSATTPVISSVKQNDSATEGSASTLTGGETTVRIFFSLTGTPDGSETLEVDLQANEVFDQNGLVGDADQTSNNTATMNDEAAPTVSITTGASDPTNSSPFSVTITFSESVSGFVVGDITVTNGTASNFVGSGTTYTADITPTGDGAVTVDVAAGVATDGAGNINTAATQLSVTYDGTAPSVTVTTGVSSPTNSSPFSVTITFSESVSGFVVGDITVTNGTASNFAGSGTTYTADITPTGDGAVTVDVAAGVATDGAGNSNTAATQLSVTYDGTAPTITISSGATNPTNGAFTATFTFSEGVTGFTVSDITVGNGSVGNFNATSASVYTATVTPTADGPVTVDVSAGVAVDGAGNSNTAATQFSRTFDGTAPTVTISSGASNPTNAPFTASFTFSESVSGFISTDITVGNGSASNFNATSTSIYTATITPTANGPVTIDVAGGVATDAAGNSNTAATQFSLTYDGTAPVSPVVSDPASSTSVVASSYTISGTHSENGVTVNAYADANNDGLADNNTSLGNAVVASGNWSFSVNLTAFSANNFVVIAEDGAGNKSAASDIPTITNVAAGFTVTQSNALTATTEAGGTDSFTVVLDGRPNSDVVINVTSADTGEATADIASLTFTSSNWSTPQTVTMTGVDDNIIDGNQTFNVTLSIDDNLSDDSFDPLGDQTVSVDNADDDAAGFTLSKTTASVSEAGTIDSFTVVLDAEPSSNVVIDVSSGDIGEVTVSTATLTFTSANWSIPQTITITGVDDVTLDGNQTTTVTLSIDQASSDNDFDSLNDQTVTVTTIDDDAPVVAFNTTASSGAESISSADLTVSLDQAISSVITVDYTVTGTATGSGTDYTLANGTLTFPANSSSQNITIAGIVDDLLDEDNETVIVTLSNPTNANLGTNTVHTYTINDNDPLSTVSFVATSSNGAESQSTVNIEAGLTNVTGRSVSVDYTVSGTATGGGVDYTLANGTLTFAAGENSKFITININNDALFEENETVIVTLSNPTNLSLGTNTTHTYTILNDDNAPIIEFNSATSSGAESVNSVNVQVDLDAVSGKDVTVDYKVSSQSTATGGGTDYVLADGTLTITAGNTSGNITITGIADDALDELDEFVIIDLSNSNGAGLGLTSRHTYTITDNDPSPTIGFNSTSSNGAESVSSANLQVDLSAVSGRDVTVDYTVTGSASGSGTDYTLASGTLTISAGSTSNNITIASIVDDLLDEDNETVIVTLSNPTGATLTANTVHTYTINDNDPTPTVTLSVSSGSIAENAGTSTITATLSAVSGRDVTVTLGLSGTATGSGTDYSISSSTIVISAGNTTGTATLTSVDDSFVEVSETIIVDIIGVTNGSESGVQQATVNITDDEVAGFTITESGGSTIVSETGTSDSFTVVLDAQPTSNVVINVTSGDTGEVTVGSASLTFTPANWNTAQTITVTGVDDVLGDGSQTTTITLAIDDATSDDSFDPLADKTVSVTTLDDDDTTAPSGYTVTLDDALIGGAEVATSTFTFAGAEIGATYNYTVSSSNGGTNVTGSGTIATATDKITLSSLTGLNDGTLTLSVTLTDAANNVGTAATATTALDATAPAAPVITSVSDDTGSSSSDGITSDNTPAVNGTAEANSTVEVFVGGSSVGTVTADGSGNWTLAYSGGSPLSDGTISVTAKATDAAGNTGNLSTAVNVTVDTSAPSAPVVTGITGDSGSSSTDAITNDQSNMVISGTAEANGTLELTFNGVTFSGLPVDANGDWSLDISNFFSADGTETARVKVTDVAGNESTETEFDITYDTTAPDAPTIDLATGSDTGESNSDKLTNDATPTLEGTAEANSTVEIFNNGNSVTTVTADSNGDWTYTPSSDIAEGIYQLTAKATDAAGNTSDPSSALEATLDLTVNAPTLSPADNGTGVLPNENLVLTFDETVSLGAGFIYIKKVSDNSLIGNFPVGSDQVSISDNVVTIEPINPLIYPGEEIYVTIDAGSFVDLAGNNYSGINNNTSWTFTVIEAPVINTGYIINDGTFKIGDQMFVAFGFSSNVTTTGNPTLPVTIGTEVKQFSLQGPATNEQYLQFYYTIQEDDLDTDGISIGNSLNLNGGSIQDEFGTDAILTISVSFRTVDLLVDGVKPTPTITSNAGTLTNAAFTATFTYDEAVTGLDLGDITVTNGTASNFTNVTAGTVWTATITPTVDGTTSVTLNAGIANDVAGNASKAGNTVSTTYDGTAPTVTSITRAEADQIPTGTTNRNFTAVFSEDVTGVDVTDFEVVTTGTATATVNSVTAVDAKTYTVNVNGISGEGTIGLNAKDDNSIIDAATNSLAAAFTGQVYTTNFAPTNITLSVSSIQENNAVGAQIGTFTTTDADAGDSFTYALVPGTGSTDNASFTISGDKLLAGAVYDFETKDSYSIRVRTSDGFGGVYEEAITISITNEPEAIIVVDGDGTFDQTVLGLSQTKNWTVTNNGDAATEVRIISSARGFSINPGSVQVGPGEVKQITAVFRPTEARVYTGVVVFNFDITDNIQDNVIEVGLTGEGVIVTGVDNGQIDEEQISVYPNPASTSITIDLSELNGMPVDIQMINPTGVSKLEKEGYDKPELTIDVTNFESGLYIIQFSNERSLVRKKVLIRK